MKMILATGTVLLVGCFGLNTVAAESPDKDQQMLQLNSTTGEQLPGGNGKVINDAALYASQVDKDANKQLEPVAQKMPVDEKIASNIVEQASDDDCD